MKDAGEACRRNEQAMAYALHALEPDEEASLRDHLAGCRSCRATATETELVAAALAGTVEQVEPPPRLRQNILDQATQTPQGGTDGTGAGSVGAVAGAGGRVGEVGARTDPAQTGTGAGAEGRGRGEARRVPGSRPATTGRGTSGPGRRRRRVVAVVLALAAVVGVVGVGGLAAYSAQVRQERDAQIAKSQALADVLIQLGRPGTSHATLATSEGEPVGVVVTTPTERMVMTAGLPSNDRGTSIYVLWGISTAAPQPIGAFDVDSAAAPGPAVHQFHPADAGQPFLGYAISLELGRSAPPTPTRVVASGQIPT